MRYCHTRIVQWNLPKLPKYFLMTMVQCFFNGLGGSNVVETKAATPICSFIVSNCRMTKVSDVYSISCLEHFNKRSWLRSAG